MNEDRQLLWEYFTFHAKQRLSTFNFYIVISSITFSGYVACMGQPHKSGIAFYLGLSLTFLSFIFFKLDQRNRHLIKLVEDQLKKWERNSSVVNGEDLSGESVTRYPIFILEEEATRSERDGLRRSLFDPHMTFYTCFLFVFAFFGVSGIVGAVYAIWH